MRREKHREGKALSQRHPASSHESSDSDPGKLTLEPALLAQASVTDGPAPGPQVPIRRPPDPKGPGVRTGRDEQAHLDPGQDGDHGDAEAEGEVEADEDLAFVAAAGLRVVDEEKRHGRDGQRVEEEGEEEEAWAGGVASGWVRRHGDPPLEGGLLGRPPCGPSASSSEE